jgi:hemerythrin-like domain-containing protein
MNISIPGFSSPAAGTEAPLEMLAACHIRIERQCATLRRLAAHLAEHGADSQARSAAAGVLRYFDTAAPLHHADEEQDLFPALLESMAGSDPVCLKGMTQGLRDEHRELEAAWGRLRPRLQAIAAAAPPAASAASAASAAPAGAAGAERPGIKEPDGPAALPAAEVEAFAALYERHIRYEEDEVLPMAARLLGDEELARIGRAMRERRGIPPV